jgi:hypothetical protein
MLDAGYLMLDAGVLTDGHVVLDGRCSIESNPGQSAAPGISQPKLSFKHQTSNIQYPSIKHQSLS